MRLSASVSRTRIVDNIIQHRGLPALVYLLHGLAHNVSGAEIARVLHVSRERVCQWKHALGASLRTYTVHDNVARLGETEFLRWNGAKFRKRPGK